jgi:RNA polymerase sigma-70 factor (ECF subfamily)
MPKKSSLYIGSWKGRKESRMLKKRHKVNLDMRNLQIEKLCSDTWKDIYRFIYYKVLNREEAEDITQETYIKAFAYLKEKNPDIDNYLGFLKTIALNILRDRWRIKKRAGYIINIEELDEGAIKSEDFTENTINHIVIEKVMQSLTFEQRRIIELRIIKGFSVVETAKVMKKSEGAIRIMQYRALQDLAEKFNSLDI